MRRESKDNLKEMAATLVLFGLVANCFGQIIYPDDQMLVRPSTIVPYIYTSNVQPQTQYPMPGAAPSFYQGNARPQYSMTPSVAHSYQAQAQPQYTMPPSVSHFYQTKARPQFSRTPNVASSYQPKAGPPLGASQTQLPMSPPPSTTQNMEQSTVTETALQEWNDHVNDIIANGVLKFGLDMEREIYKTRSLSMLEQQNNIVFSPISLTVTLAIVLAGSAGKTFQEVARVLGLESGVDVSQNSEIVHQMFGLLLNQFHKEMLGPNAPRTDFALATYVQDGFPILPQFKALSNEVYGNDVINVDFVKKGRETQQMINDWVKQKTMGKISSILDEVPGAMSRVILLSALYFHGEWNQHFITGATKKKPFFIEPDQAVNVDMMYNGGPFPFYEDRQLGVKILGLPYKGHEMTMYILLPTAKGAKALRAFQNQLTVDKIENLIKNVNNETCIIALPKMKLSSSLDLQPILSELGVNSLFDPMTADLSLMSQGNNENVGNIAMSTKFTTPMMSPTGSRTGNSNQALPMATPHSNNRDVLIFSRFGPDQVKGDKKNRMVKRNYFVYEDDVNGYNVEQWANGFSIKKNRKSRDVRNKEDRNSYKVQEESQVNDHAKVVSLEGNKYRFQKNEERRRNRRQSRPINPDFLNLVKHRNFPSYGLDDIRNNANLVNPHLFASKALHKVEIDITEKGTEAAAATAVTLDRDGSQKKLIANRPFIFFIRHDPTRLVLFWGTVNTPTPHYPAT
ncbi:uncharacterized protein LOC143429709 [Xylocopa sonorina]|uniref:uncharacterized protein LOC143429709 n=1 Tax=Xylocopa sonorina TaxID=1818115 RepID=UPI00403ABA0C